MELPIIGEQNAFSRSRELGRLLLEVVVWVLAFSLLFCVPTEQGTGGHPERARPAETR